MPERNPLSERISLLQMGEAQGRLKPEHRAELERYRKQGIARSGAPAAAAATAVGGLIETASARDKARSAMALIERVGPQIGRVRQLQSSTLGSQGVAALKEYNPLSSANQQYDAAVANLTALARPATRSPGEGPMSDFESRLAVAILPHRWKRDSYNTEALNGLQRLVDGSRDLYSRQLGMGPQANRPLPNAPPNSRRAPVPKPSADDLRARYGLK